jgi:hypothetical protein
MLRSPEKQMDLKPFLPKINPISGTEIQSQFRDALANGFDIAEEPIFQVIECERGLWLWFERREQ